ncbi:hypothetical protein ACG2LH_12215 [Zhouia sp. PK063]|uniref:hypothetical protein n=1 Tax=Zhouia sp. PK063 TaxID=3373602 RepID=UPI0037B96D79
MGLSNLGIFHTIVGVAAIVGAIIDYARYGKINLDSYFGKIYWYGTLITSLTALGLSSIKGINPGHILALLIIILITIAGYLYYKKKGYIKARFVENFFLSFSFFLSLIPTVNETFNRIPVSHPLANGPQDPLIKNTLLILFVVFIIGSVFQFKKQKQSNKLAAQ